MLLQIVSLTNSSIGWARDMINVGDLGRGLNSLLAGASIVNDGADGKSAACSISLPSQRDVWTDGADEDTDNNLVADRMYIRGEYTIRNDGRTAIGAPLKAVDCKHVTSAVSIAVNTAEEFFDGRVPYSDPYVNDGGLNQRLDNSSGVSDMYFTLTEVGQPMAVGRTSTFELVVSCPAGDARQCRLPVCSCPVVDNDLLSRPEALDKLMELAANITYQLSRGSITDPAEVIYSIELINEIFSSKDTLMHGTTTKAIDILGELLRSYEAGQLPYQTTYDAILVLDRAITERSIYRRTDVESFSDKPVVGLSEISTSTIFVTVAFPANLTTDDVILTLIYRTGPDGKQELVASLPNGANTFEDTGLKYGTTYTYTATMTTESGFTTDYADPVSGTTLIPDVLPPIIDDWLSVTTESVELVVSDEFDWTAGNPEVAEFDWSIDYLEAQRIQKPRPGEDWTAGGAVNGTRITVPNTFVFNDTGLQAGSVYDYYVRAVATTGKRSPFDATAKYTVYTCPTHPTISTTANSNTSITFVIDSPVGGSARVASQVKVYRIYGDDPEVELSSSSFSGEPPALNDDISHTDVGLLAGRAYVYSTEYVISVSDHTFTCSRSDGTTLYTDPSPPKVSINGTTTEGATIRIDCPEDALDQFIQTVTIYRIDNGVRTTVTTISACDGNTDSVYFTDNGAPDGTTPEYVAEFNGEHGTTSPESGSPVPASLPPPPPTLTEIDTNQNSSTFKIALPDDAHDIKEVCLYRKLVDAKVFLGCVAWPGESEREMSYKDDGLLPGRTYEYTAYLVKDDDKNSTSALSNVLTVYTDPSTPVIGEKKELRTNDGPTLEIACPFDATLQFIQSVSIWRNGVLIAEDIPACNDADGYGPVVYTDLGASNGTSPTYKAVFNGEHDTKSPESAPKTISLPPSPPILSEVSGTNGTKADIKIDLPADAEDIKEVCLFRYLAGSSVAESKTCYPWPENGETSITVTDTGLIPGKEYEYRGELEKDDSEGIKSGESDPISVWSSPNAPSLDILGSNTTCVHVQITVTAPVAGVKEVVIKRDGVEVKRITVTAPQAVYSFWDCNLDSSAEYDYTAQSIGQGDKNTPSPVSETESGHTAPPPPVLSAVGVPDSDSFTVKVTLPSTVSASEVNTIDIYRNGGDSPYKTVTIESGTEVTFTEEGMTAGTNHT
eukprot:tig00021501_g21954.t1